MISASTALECQAWGGGQCGDRTGGVIGHPPGAPHWAQCGAKGRSIRAVVGCRGRCHREHLYPWFSPAYRYIATKTYAEFTSSVFSKGSVCTKNFMVSLPTLFL